MIVYKFRSHFKLAGKKQIAIAMLFLLAISVATIPRIVRAATCSSIANCQQQIADSKSAVSQLIDQATSYQDAVNHLNAQIYQLQVSINASLAQQAQLEKQITDDQLKIEQKKNQLGATIKAMYLDGQTSTIEQLAISNSLSDYVDKQAYRQKVQDQLNAVIEEVQKLQIEQKQQKTQVDALVAQQKDQQNQVLEARANQNNLLSYNRSQQDAYNAQTASNQQTLNNLIAAQRRANNSLNGGYYFIHFPGKITADPINGSYPYSSWPFSMSTAPGCVDGDGPDQWGYCTRQCVSYAAWAVEYSGRKAPVGWGDAKSWIYGARNAGISFDLVPMAGDIAISTHGNWGHAMYVEEVSGNQMHVSEYNQQLDGHLRTDRWIPYL
jgi:peptidoglycan hydrolase CwlO-like protein